MKRQSAYHQLITRLTMIVALAPFFLLAALQTPAYAATHHTTATHVSKPLPRLRTVRSGPIPASSRGNKLPAGWIRPFPAPARTHMGSQDPLGAFCHQNPTPPCAPPVSNQNNNRVLHTPHVLVIFWGPNWYDPSQTEAQQVLQNELTLFVNLAGSNYNNLLTQYFDGQGSITNNPSDPVYQGGAIDLTPPPANIDTGAEATEINYVISAIPNWGQISDSIFFLFPQQGSTYNDPTLVNGCAYHSVTADGNNRIYAMDPYADFQPGCINAGTLVDSMTSTASHEYAEAASDPLANQGATRAWQDQSGYEIGDLCSWTSTPLQELGGVVVQQLFSNKSYAANNTQGCEYSG